MVNYSPIYKNKPKESSQNSRYSSLDPTSPRGSCSKNCVWSVVLSLQLLTELCQTAPSRDAERQVLNCHSPTLFYGVSMELHWVFLNFNLCLEFIQLFEIAT